MSAPASAFTVERVRHPIVVRTLTVVTIESLCPNYVRMGLAGPDLDGFISMGFDDHVKIFFAASATKTPVIPYTTETGVGFPEGSEKPLARDYTPRHYDAEKGFGFLFESGVIFLHVSPPVFCIEPLSESSFLICPENTTQTTTPICHGFVVG